MKFLMQNWECFVFHKHEFSNAPDNTFGQINIYYHTSKPKAEYLAYR